jgi:hypothetical protein
VGAKPLPIVDWSIGYRPIKNRQLKIGKHLTHPLPRLCPKSARQISTRINNHIPAATLKSGEIAVSIAVNRFNICRSWKRLATAIEESDVMVASYGGGHYMTPDESCPAKN